MNDPDCEQALKNLTTINHPCGTKADEQLKLKTVFQGVTMSLRDALKG